MTLFQVPNCTFICTECEWTSRGFINRNETPAFSSVATTPQRCDTKNCQGTVLVEFDKSTPGLSEHPFRR